MRNRPPSLNEREIREGSGKAANHMMNEYIIKKTPHYNMFIEKELKNKEAHA